MGKILIFFDQLINLLTGWNSRHNRALREITDLSHAIDEFIAEYRIPADIFGNIGKARIDITSIAYQTRTKMKVAKQIRGKRIAPLVKQLNNNLETVREDIYTTKRGKEYLREDLSNLNNALRVLTDSISDISYK